MEEKSLRECYENYQCPDCGEEIPVDTTDGDECVNCGHVFWHDNSIQTD